MVRISAELLSQAEQRTNPNEDRELVLRDFGIPAIENMGAARDEFDAFDLSNNRISRLENFPKLHRLSSLFCAGNSIDSIDAKNIQKNVPNLKSLTLSDNNISALAEVANIATACPKLEFLSLSGNPVTRRQYYRLYAIHKMPNLKVLDYAKVKPAEREKAERLANSAAGAALESDVAIEAKRTKTFVPGESEQGQSVAAVVNFTDEERQQVRELLANASSAKEVEEIEAAIRRGVLPVALMQRKRKREEGTNKVSDDEVPAKKSKDS